MERAKTAQETTRYEPVHQLFTPLSSAGDSVVRSLFDRGASFKVAAFRASILSTTLLPESDLPLINLFLLAEAL